MDGDGIDEDLTRAVSVAMLAAARAGEHFARMNQTAAAEREARAAGQTEQAQRELGAQTEAARAYFEVTARPEYTGAATSEQLHEVARAAEQWRERLDEAQRADDAATTELTARRSASATFERATVLVEADAADRNVDESDLAEQHSNTIGEPDLAGDETGAVRANLVGREAFAIAKTAQPRPAQEAPGVGIPGSARQSSGQQKAAQSRRKAVER